MGYLCEQLTRNKEPCLIAYTRKWMRPKLRSLKHQNKMNTTGEREKKPYYVALLDGKREMCSLLETIFHSSSIFQAFIHLISVLNTTNTPVLLSSFHSSNDSLKMRVFTFNFSQILKTHLCYQLKNHSNANRKCVITYKELVSVKKRAVFWSEHSSFKIRWNRTFHLYYTYHFCAQTGRIYPLIDLLCLIP